ncbi:MAG: NUDIX domain-containing protein [Sedimenticolaceae bacterium]
MTMKFELHGSEAVYEGFFKLNRYRLQHSSFHGGWCTQMVRERIERLAAVSVLLYDPQLDTLVLVEQFRIGLMGTVDPPWSLETVSGFCDREHELPEEVARREVVEETGCALRALTHIGEFFVSPGMSVERINLYCGWVDAGNAGGIHGLDHEGEEMRVVTLSRAEALAQLFKRLNSTSVIMALQWLEANREQLAEKWRLEAATR